MKGFLHSLKFLKKIDGRLAGGLLTHVFVWCYFIAVGIQLLSFERGYSKNIWNSVIFFGIQAFFFYANSYYWLPKVFRNEQGSRERYVKLMGIQLICFAVFLITVSMMFGDLRISFEGSVQDWIWVPYNFSAFISPFLAYWPFSTGYYYFIYSKQVRIDNERLRGEAMLLSQRWLKAELNPHFLNNCYHFLDGLLLIDVHKAEEGLSLMQEMMQYYLTIPTNGFITIEEELAQCRNLMTLYGLQHGKIFVSIWVGKDVPPLLCLPMCLVLLMENILKYGVIKKRNVIAELRLEYREGVLEITSFNKISKKREHNTASTGRGLANLEAQLQYFYPDAFCLSRYERDGFYHFSLQIWLDKKR